MKINDYYDFKAVFEQDILDNPELTSTEDYRIFLANQPFLRAAPNNFYDDDQERSFVELRQHLEEMHSKSPIDKTLSAYDSYWNLHRK